MAGATRVCMREASIPNLPGNSYFEVRFRKSKRGAERRRSFTFTRSPDGAVCETGHSRTGLPIGSGWSEAKEGRGESARCRGGTAAGDPRRRMVRWVLTKGKAAQPRSGSRVIPPPRTNSGPGPTLGHDDVVTGTSTPPRTGRPQWGGSFYPGGHRRLHRRGSVLLTFIPRRTAPYTWGRAGPARAEPGGRKKPVSWHAAVTAVLLNGGRSTRSSAPGVCKLRRTKGCRDVAPRRASNDPGGRHAEWGGGGWRAGGGRGRVVARGGGGGGGVGDSRQDGRRGARLLQRRSGPARDRRKRLFGPAAAARTHHTTARGFPAEPPGAAAGSPPDHAASGASGPVHAVAQRVRMKFAGVFARGGRGLGPRARAGGDGLIRAPWAASPSGQVQ